MFKALVAASIAMLVCCAAAAMAGPVQPVVDFGHVAEEADLPAENPSLFRPSLLRLVVEPPHDLPPTRLDTFAAFDGFVPSVSLATLHHGTIGGVALPPEEIASIEPVLQPAVIPLPMPLYAAVLLLALTLLARRAILRAC